MFRVDALKKSKILVNFHAFTEVLGHLFALWHLVGTEKSVVIEALYVGSFIRQTRKFLISLIVMMITLY
jgi:hypothetical protein